MGINRGRAQLKRANVASLVNISRAALEARRRGGRNREAPRRKGLGFENQADTGGGRGEKFIMPVPRRGDTFAKSRKENTRGSGGEVWGRGDKKRFTIVLVGWVDIKKTTSAGRSAGS
ncbi:hypothetical protein KM043_001977 [Ampulex compressa]|nr:hypothetical protein KM043_001977 [Ampulex compressa]